MITELKGNLWDYHVNGEWCCITTNGFVKLTGECVMGKGVAFQAKYRFPNLPMELGARIKEDGNHVFTFSSYRLITFPVKHKWWELADLDLIKRSAEELYDYLDAAGSIKRVYLPRPGCGNGMLTWKLVKPVLESVWQPHADKFEIMVINNE
jgi:hypothetical protein